VIRDAVMDIDSNKYDAVRIGDQVWMAENLKTTRYADGTSIPKGDTYSSEVPYRYLPGTNKSDDGYLYNWPAVMHGASSSNANPSGVQGICPKGWHVPSDAEWTQLTNYMKTQAIYVSGGNADHLAKALAYTQGWSKSNDEYTPGKNPANNNASGFSAVAVGHCYGTSCYLVGTSANFWSSTLNDENNTAAWVRNLAYNNAEVTQRCSYNYYGFSVRCLRDN